MATRYIGDANSQSKLKGAADGVASPAGYIGEVVETAVGPTAASSSNIPFNVGFVDVPPGRWRVEAWAGFSKGTASGVSGVIFDLNTVSATRRFSETNLEIINANFPSGPIYSLEVNSTSTTRVYLIAFYNFSSVGTSDVSGSIKYTRIG